MPARTWCFVSGAGAALLQERIELDSHDLNRTLVRMGQRKNETQKPRIRGTSWCWVWLDPDQMPLHQPTLQGFIIQDRRRVRRDNRGEYGEWWIQVLLRDREGAEPFAIWVPEHQLRPVGEGIVPPSWPSYRTTLFDSVASRRQRSAQYRPR